MTMLRNAEPENILNVLMKVQSAMTFELAISQEKKISWLRKNESDDLRNLIGWMVFSLDQALGLPRPLTQFQINDITETVISDYWRLSPEEVLYVFKKGKKGEYEPIYNQLDISKICMWLDRYIYQELQPYAVKQHENYSKTPDEGDAIRKALELHAGQSEELKINLLTAFQVDIKLLK